VFIYSLKEGINDGFLTPFRVKQISTTLDEYVYTPDDTLLAGEIEIGKRYEEGDFNKIIEIREREKSASRSSCRRSTSERRRSSSAPARRTHWRCAT
jgi:type I site-specific restriction endonuclease